MREIKFRAWDKNEQIGMIENPKLDVVMKDERYSLMQFTGLKDKNGKEIYEEDIVKYYNKEKITKTEVEARFKVIFFNGMFVQKHPHGDPDIWYDWNEVEVIGNIYETPELLKEVKELKR